MIVFPNAKINLGLHVVEKRSDGFHNLETVFYPVPWTDVLEVVPSQGAIATLHQSGIAVDAASEKNLVMKAYRMLADDYQLPPVDIYLHKAIPFGAGLGGGSSDAAFMLKLLNTQFALNLPDSKLEAYAARLGSDCPFFIANRPMIATSRGEILSPIDVSLSGYWIALAKPSFGISTPEAFSGIVPNPKHNALAGIVARPIAEWQGTMINDFESHLFAKHSELASIKSMMYAQGAVYAAMSGSGSTIFGIFDREPAIDIDGATLFTAKL